MDLWEEEEEEERKNERKKKEKKKKKKKKKNNNSNNNKTLFCWCGNIHYRLLFEHGGSSVGAVVSSVDYGSLRKTKTKTKKRSFAEAILSSVDYGYLNTTAFLSVQ